jgi:hypothetical protein
MKTQNHSLLVALFFICCITTTFAGNYTWVGNISTSWTTTTNWSPNGNPSTNDTVTIVGGKFNCTLAANTTVKNLTMTSDTLDFNSFTLTIGTIATINNGFMTNGTLASLDNSSVAFNGGKLSITVNIKGISIAFSGSVFNNSVTAVFKGTSAKAAGGNGGNIFNSTLTLIDSGSAPWSFAGINPDTCYDIVLITNTGSGPLYFAHKSYDNYFAKKVTFSNSSSGTIFCSYYETATFDDSVIVNSTGTGAIRFGVASGETTMNSFLGMGGAGLSSSGLLEFIGVDQTDPSQNISLTGSNASRISFGANSKFEATITASAPGLSLDGSTFDGKAIMTHSGNLTTSCKGGCVFNDSTWINHNNSSGGALFLATINADTYNAPVTIENTNRGKVVVTRATFSDNTILINNSPGITTGGGPVPLSNSPYTFLVADGARCVFDSDLKLVNDSGGIFFGTSHGDVDFQSGSSLTIDSSYIGKLFFSNVEYSGNAAIKIPFDSNFDILYFDSNNVFNAPVICNVRRVLLNGSTFNDTLLLKSLAMDYDTSRGGNVFNGYTVLVDSAIASGKPMVLARTYPDDFNGNVIFKQYGSGRIYPCHTKNSTFSGDITWDGTSEITFGQNGGRMIIDGDSNHVFDKMGINQLLIKKLEMKKTGGVFTLYTPITVKDSVIFTKGYMAADSVRPLIIPDSGIVSGASDSSFVIGLVKKIGNDAFTFPIGSIDTTEKYYHPLSISAPSHITDAFTAEYLNVDHGLGSSSDTTIGLISETEYWKLLHLNGSDSILVSLGWNINSSNTTQLLGMKVTYWNGLKWKDLGNSNTSGNQILGNVTAGNLENGSGYFTLANVHCYLEVDAGPAIHLMAEDSTIILSSLTNYGNGSVNYQWTTGETTAYIEASVQGEYRVDVVDGTGCTANRDIKVIFPSPNSSFWLPPALCEEFPETLYCDLCPGNLVWDFGDGTSATSFIPSIAHLYNDPGIYDLTVTGPSLAVKRHYYIYVLPSSTVQNYNPGCCYRNYNSYTYTNQVTISASSHPIISPLHWSTNATIKNIVIIETGAGLVIDAGAVISFGPSGKIIVQNGGQLTITDNAIVGAIDYGAGCGKMMWNGIEVWGNASSSNSTAQGKIILNNGATIEDAYTGVMLGRTKLVPDGSGSFLSNTHEASYGGGIIMANNSTFNRCAVGVLFWEYPFANNWNSITSCNFYCKTSNVNSPLLDPYLLMFNTYGDYVITLGGHNPFYRWSTDFRRTNSGIRSYERRTLNFIDNVFDYPASGIEAINSKLNVIKGTGAGNQFIDVYWNLELSDLLTNAFGSKITDNYFDFPNGVIGGTAGIEIDYRKYDLINNNQINSSIAVNFNTVTNFKVNDNTFNQCHYGVSVHKSGSPASEISYTESGNSFINNYWAVITDNINDKLDIHCNTFTPTSGWGGYNWKIQNGTLKNQGVSGNAVNNPAGNRFLTSSLKGLSSDVNFNYYFHGGTPVTTEPIQVAGGGVIGISGNTALFPLDPDDACEPECWPPGPWCNPALISSLQTEIDNLQTDFDEIEESLDNGETSEIINSITSAEVTNNDLMELLISNSPLSDVVLNSVINNRDSLSSAQIVSLFIPNTPVSNSILPTFLNVLSVLDEIDADTLRSLQGFNPNYSTLTQFQRIIDNTETKRQIALNDLIRYFIDSDSIYEAIELLKGEYSLESKQALIGTYITINELDSAEDLLEGLSLASSEDSAYFDLYNIYISLKRDVKSIWELDSAQKARMMEIASMCPVSLPTGNAQIALHLVYGINFDTCEAEEGFRTGTNVYINNKEENYYNPEYLGKVFPNPFTDKTYIPYFIPKGSHATISIYAMDGNLIFTKALIDGNNFIQIDLTKYCSGLYLCYLNIDEGKIIERKKLILNK